MELNAEKGTELRDDGIAKSVAAELGWHFKTLPRLTDWSKLRYPSTFTMEDFRAWCEENKVSLPHGTGEWGALAKVAIDRKFIVPVGYINAKSATAHRRVIRVYLARIEAK